MFLHVSVCSRGGGVVGVGVCRGACIVGVMCGGGGMHGRGCAYGGMHGRGHAW